MPLVYILGRNTPSQAMFLAISARCRSDQYKSRDVQSIAYQAIVATVFFTWISSIENCLLRPVNFMGRWTLLPLGFDNIIC